MGKQINIQVWISSESWSGNTDWKSPNSGGEVTGCTRSNIDRRVLLVKLCPFKTVVLKLFSPGIVLWKTRFPQKNCGRSHGERMVSG